ncbi:hypothetical protein HDU97_000833 [Phlyctochytrium planicorne]|nr:hypothetical protein HDU97_000833 [Phlyctochytrium planicorne]
MDFLILDSLKPSERQKSFERLCTLLSQPQAFIESCTGQWDVLFGRLSKYAILEKEQALNKGITDTRDKKLRHIARTFIDISELGRKDETFIAFLPSCVGHAAALIWDEEGLFDQYSALTGLIADLTDIKDCRDSIKEWRDLLRTCSGTILDICTPPEDEARSLSKYPIHALYICRIMGNLIHSNAPHVEKELFNVADVCIRILEHCSTDLAMLELLLDSLRHCFLETAVANMSHSIILQFEKTVPILLHLLESIPSKETERISSVKLCILSLARLIIESEPKAEFLQQFWDMCSKELNSSKLKPLNDILVLEMSDALADDEVSSAREHELETCILQMSKRELQSRSVLLLLSRTIALSLAYGDYIRSEANEKRNRHFSSRLEMQSLAIEHTTWLLQALTLYLAQPLHRVDQDSLTMLFEFTPDAGRMTSAGYVFLKHFYRTCCRAFGTEYAMQKFSPLQYLFSNLKLSDSDVDMASAEFLVALYEENMIPSALQEKCISILLNSSKRKLNMVAMIRLYTCILFRKPSFLAIYEVFDVIYRHLNAKEHFASTLCYGRYSPFSIKSALLDLFYYNSKVSMACVPFDRMKYFGKEFFSQHCEISFEFRLAESVSVIRSSKGWDFNRGRNITKEKIYPTVVGSSFLNFYSRLWVTFGVKDDAGNFCRVNTHNICGHASGFAVLAALASYVVESQKAEASELVRSLVPLASEISTFLAGQWMPDQATAIYIFENLSFGFHRLIEIMEHAHLQHRDIQAAAIQLCDFAEMCKKFKAFQDLANTLDPLSATKKAISRSNSNDPRNNLKQAYLIYIALNCFWAASCVLPDERNTALSVMKSPRLLDDGYFQYAAIMTLGSFDNLNPQATS